MSSGTPHHMSPMVKKLIAYLVVFIITCCALSCLTTGPVVNKDKRASGKTMDLLPYNCCCAILLTIITIVVSMTLSRGLVDPNASQ